MRLIILILLSVFDVFRNDAQASTSHLVVAVEQANDTVGFYESATFARLGQVKVGRNPHEVAIASDGRTAYVSNFGIQDYDETIGTPGLSVSVIDVPTMTEVRRLQTFPDRAPHGVKLRPPGESELFVNTEKPARMIVFDAETGAVKRRFDVDPKTHNFVFSPDGAMLWLMAGTSGILAVDPDDGRVLASHSMASPVRGLTLTSDARTLVASGKDEIELLDPVTLTTRKRFSGFGVGQLLYAAPSPDGRYIVAPAVWDSVVLVIDMGSGHVVKRFLSGLDPVAVAYSPDGRTAYISNARDTGLTVIDLTSLTSRRVTTNYGPNGLATSVFVPARAGGESILFGAVLPLSGRDATFGREMMLGYELWKRDVNAKGGLHAGGRSYSVRTIYADSASNDDQSEPLAEELLAQGTRFLLGTYGTPANGAVASVAARRQIPVVTSAGAARSLYQQGNRYLFGIMAPASEYLLGGIDVALTQSPAPNRAAILASDAPAPLEDARNAANHARDRGLLQVTLSPETLAEAGLVLDPSGALIYANGRQDFDSIIRALAAASVDLLVMAGGVADSMAVVRSSKAIGFSPAGFAFSVGPSVPLFASPMGLGYFAQYLIGATQWSPMAPTRGSDRYGTAEAFAAAFWDAYFARASYLSAGAYATGIVYEEALLRSGDLEPGGVRSALAATNLETFYGPIDFNQDGLNEDKPVYTIQLLLNGTRVLERLLWPQGENAQSPVWPFPGWP